MCEFGKRGGDIAKDFAIDVLFEYEEDDGSTLMWCQGKVVDFIRESKGIMCLLRLNGVISVGEKEI